MWFVPTRAGCSVSCSPGAKVNLDTCINPSQVTIAAKICNDIAQLQTRLYSCTRNRKQLNFRCQELRVVGRELFKPLNLFDVSANSSVEQHFPRSCFKTKLPRRLAFYYEPLSFAIMCFSVFTAFFCCIITKTHMSLLSKNAVLVLLIHQRMEQLWLSLDHY